MKIRELVDMLPGGFSDRSKVWIFQSNRPFGEKEEQEINEQLLQFYEQWESHGGLVKGWAKLIFRQFVIVMADDTADRICGSATDRMMRLMKSLERQYDIQLFDRMMLTFLIDGKAQMLPFDQLSYALEKGFIQEDSLYFNHAAVSNQEELLENWLVPLKDSWLASRLGIGATSS